MRGSTCLFSIAESDRFRNSVSSESLSRMRFALPRVVHFRDKGKDSIFGRPRVYAYDRLAMVWLPAKTIVREGRRGWCSILVLFVNTIVSTSTLNRFIYSGGGDIGRRRLSSIRDVRLNIERFFLLACKETRRYSNNNKSSNGGRAPVSLSVPDDYAKIIVTPVTQFL